MSTSVEQQLAALPTLAKPQLEQLWKQLFNTTPNASMRKALIVRFLAYRIQEQAYGSLNKRSRKRVEELVVALAANPNDELTPSPQIRPGTRLVRQWRDQVHVVHVEEQTYEYRGTRYESLSEIARLITGTRWSGPLFFGLKQNQPTTEVANARV
jgi:K+-sensing histidine kinase KdpD